MSFSSDIKNQISEAEPKKSCCKESIERGIRLEDFEGKCDKDLGMYLRGVFLKYGGITAPGRNFMLSFLLPDEASATKLTEILEAADLPPKRSTRRNKPLLYYKATESIEDLLSYIGATKAALDIFSKKVLSDVRNNMNRLCNAETANQDRIARAAAEQREAIKIIEKYGALQNLPFELRECAQLRLENPEMSLTEMRNLLTSPVSKSGLNHRFKKLIEIAESYKEL
ncbi:MAG: DNA-binding protein WhiA [Ruminococcaceae bacterium]|nr:DNA-binding protein WhiA [Oscillospiraceae bacterium]